MTNGTRLVCWNADGEVAHDECYSPGDAGAAFDAARWHAELPYARLVLYDANGQVVEEARLTDKGYVGTGYWIEGEK